MPQGVLTARINGKYESKFNFNFINYADLGAEKLRHRRFLRPLQPPEGRLGELQAYVRNFTNTVYWAHAGSGTPWRLRTTTTSSLRRAPMV